MSSLVSQVFVSEFALGTVLCHENGTKSLAATVPEQVEGILCHDSYHCSTKGRSKSCLERGGVRAWVHVCVWGGGTISVSLSLSHFMFRHCEGQLSSCM